MKSKPSVTIQAKCGCGNVYITGTFTTKGKLHDVKVSMGKAGGCAAATTGTISNLVSLAVMHHLPISAVINALKGASCHTANKQSTPPVLSCIDAIAESLELMEAEHASTTDNIPVVQSP